MTVILFLAKKSGAEQGSVRWCVVVMQQTVVLLPKFRVTCLHIFKKSQCERWNYCLAYFVHSSLDVKANYEDALHMHSLFILVRLDFSMGGLFSVSGL